MRLRARILLLFLALFVVMVADVGVETWAEHDRDRANHVVDKQLVPARDELHNLLTSLVDQETGERGFLLTGKDSFLQPYTDGKRQTARSLDRLNTLFANDQDALAAIDRVRSRVDAWQQLAADFEIDAKQSGRDKLVTALVSSGTGKQLFERVRSEVADTESFLDRRLAQQRRHVSNVTRRLDIIRGFSVLLSLAIIVLTGRLVLQWVTEPL